MADLFDDQWLSQAAGSLSPLLSDYRGDVSVSFTALAGPSGDVATTWVVKDGEASASQGNNADADVVFALPWKDVVAVVDGSLEPPVAYMQGKLKTSGNMERALLILSAASTDAFSQWRSALAD